MTKKIVVLVLVMLIITMMSVNASDKNVDFSCSVPYSLGKVRTTAYPGESIRAFFSMESRQQEPKVITMQIKLPPGFIVTDVPPDQWQVTTSSTGMMLSGPINLAGGYGHWFELVGIKSNNDIEAGTYKIDMTVHEDGQSISKEYYFTVQTTQQLLTDGTLRLEKVSIPVDRDGEKDERLNTNTLNLRDQTLDYYKNILRGKGAVNILAESMHPIAYMGLDFSNPTAQQKLLLITAQLLDKNSGQPVSGLITPASNVEDKDAGAFGGARDQLAALVALQGQFQERVNIPVYVDDKVLAGGTYTMKITAQEEGQASLTYEFPINIIRSHAKAGFITCVALLCVMVGLIWGLYHRRGLLKQMKTRWLVTIALFGTTSFAMVNVPATFLNDIFHIILGPFGFLVTGLFNGVFLYMLIVSLVILLPFPGVITLMTLVRMLLSMLVFGHVSPVSMLLYGSQALILEVLLYTAAITRGKKSMLVTIAREKLLTIVISCGVADALATYINLQALSFLYRLFYADWYIMLCVVVNGFLYTAVGALCGVYLGRELGKIGGD